MKEKVDVPDLLNTRHKFMSMIAFAGKINPLAAVERPVNPYALCWCDSGKKWKFCHKDREKLKPLSFGEINAERFKYSKTGSCQHPEASSLNCSTQSSILSHTIQRRGGLAAIAEDGHVYSTRKAFTEINKREGQIDMTKVGVRSASTFPGFCSIHDTDLFRRVELPLSKLDHYNGFLLSLRAVTFELVTKDATLRSHIAIKAFIDNGKPFESQVAIQNYSILFQRGMEQGLADVKALKTKYDAAFLNTDFSGFSFYGIEFDRLLPFAAAGAFFPEYDFVGEQLQELKMGSDVSQIALNITQLGTNTCVGFGWFDGPNTAAAKLVESFKNIPDDEKSNAVLVLAMEHLENFFCTPSWWDDLAPDVSTRLHAKIAGGLQDRSPTALIEPGLKAVESKVKNKFEV